MLLSCWFLKFFKYWLTAGVARRTCMENVCICAPIPRSLQYYSISGLKKKNHITGAYRQNPNDSLLWATLSVNIASYQAPTKRSILDSSVRRLSRLVIAFELYTQWVKKSIKPTLAVLYVGRTKSGKKSIGQQTWTLDSSVVFLSFKNTQVK